MYGREKGFDEKAQESAKKLGKQPAKVFLELRTEYQEKGNTEALEKAQAMLDQAGSLSTADRELLYGYLLGSRKQILAEPQALLTEASRFAWTRWRENVEKLRQYDCPARRQGNDCAENPYHANRSGTSQTDRSGRSGQMSCLVVP